MFGKKGCYGVGLSLTVVRNEDKKILVGEKLIGLITAIQCALKLFIYLLAYSQKRAELERNSNTVPQ